MKTLKEKIDHAKLQCAIYIFKSIFIFIFLKTYFM